MIDDKYLASTRCDGMFLTGNSLYSFYQQRINITKLAGVTTSTPATMILFGNGTWHDRIYGLFDVGNLPSGKHTKNYGKSPFFMGKSTISTGPFSIANCKRLPGRVWCFKPDGKCPCLTSFNSTFFWPKYGGAASRQERSSCTHKIHFWFPSRRQLNRSGYS